jgi:hypothetical protein
VPLDHYGLDDLDRVRARPERQNAMPKQSEWQRGLHVMPVMTRVEFSILWLVGLLYYFVTAPRDMTPFPVAVGWAIILTTIYALVVLSRRFPLFGFFLVALVAGLMRGGRRRRW